MTTRFGILFGTALLSVALTLSGCFCGAGFSGSEMSLYLTDSATGAPVRDPVFTEDGNSIYPNCMEPDAHDSSLCTAQVLWLSTGSHAIRVTAAGYAPETVQVDTQLTDSAHLAVQMHAMR